ncbi:hypothetical protein HIO71_05020 [Chryseobacterium aquaticum]|uniref:Uncharacterized protein n=1 Tax=Chryseobacterium aquaticum TaxID=452084 RepID=A0A848MY52_9FLAO|nr:MULTISPECIES: hypothetical protein [Chryseobacterium]NMR33567.1 hypothetical protein [Chryseobacterium aquaticum]NRQ45641.1 hypothetical protein [Chryseobacterium sp. C-204]
MKNLFLGLVATFLFSIFSFAQKTDITSVNTEYIKIKNASLDLASSCTSDKEFISFLTLDSQEANANMIALLSNVYSNQNSSDEDLLKNENTYQIFVKLIEDLKATNFKELSYEEKVKHLFGNDVESYENTAKIPKCGKKCVKVIIRVIIEVVSAVIDWFS